MPTEPTVRVVICDVEQFDGDWPTSGYPTRLLDAIAWLQSKLEEVPPEYLDRATCRIDSTSGYESSHYGHIEISYDRPETAAERVDRLAREKRALAARRERELEKARATLARYGEHR